MAYKAIVNSNIKVAFNLLKDLAVTAVLNKKKPATFDFATATITANTEDIVTTKIVIVSSDKSMEKSNSIVSEILLKTKETGDLSFYDTITIDNDVWKLGQKINSDGYITLLKIFREK